MGLGSYPSAEMQSVYSTTSVDWAFFIVRLITYCNKLPEHVKRAKSINGF